MAPCNVMDWEPVTAVPGLKPRSPVIVVGPVLVIVEPARTAKPSAVPRPTGAWAEAVAGGTSVKETRASPTAPDPSRGEKSSSGFHCRSPPTREWMVDGIHGRPTPSLSNPDPQTSRLILTASCCPIQVMPGLERQSRISSTLASRSAATVSSRVMLSESVLARSKGWPNWSDVLVLLRAPRAGYTHLSRENGLAHIGR